MNKKNIEIDKIPFAETRYYSGVYSAKETYSFTIVIEDYGDTGVKYVHKITWEGDRPKNFRQVEKKIEKYWLLINLKNLNT